MGGRLGQAPRMATRVGSPILRHVRREQRREGRRYQRATINQTAVRQSKDLHKHAAPFSHAAPGFSTVTERNHKDQNTFICESKPLSYVKV